MSVRPSVKKITAMMGLKVTNGLALSVACFTINKDVLGRGYNPSCDICCVELLSCDVCLFFALGGALQCSYIDVKCHCCSVAFIYFQREMLLLYIIRVFLELLLHCLFVCLFH